MLALARAEERHAAHWSAKLHGAGQMPLGPGVRSRVLSWLARRVGSLFVLSLVQRAEAAGDYDTESPRPPQGWRPTSACTPWSWPGWPNGVAPAPSG